MVISSAQILFLKSTLSNKVCWESVLALIFLRQEDIPKMKLLESRTLFLDLDASIWEDENGLIYRIKMYFEYFLTL